MGDHGELANGLRRRGDGLDQSGEPVSVEEALPRHPRPTRRSGLPGTTVVGVATVVLGIVVGGALQLDRGHDDHPVSIAGSPDPQPTTAAATAQVSSPRPPTTVAASRAEGLAIENLPDRGIAVVDDDRLRLLSLGGEELATMPAPDVTWQTGLTVLRVRSGSSIELVGADQAQAPEGCEAAAGGGGVRIALCGGKAGLRDRIERVAPDGRRSVLIGPAPGSNSRGHWRRAAPSPDGRWLLAQWSGECEVPTAWLATIDGGDLRTVDGALRVGAGVGSTALGWSQDSRALVTLGQGSCGPGGERPGVYAVDPHSGEQELLVPLPSIRAAALIWERAPSRSLSSATGPTGGPSGSGSGEPGAGIAEERSRPIARTILRR